MSCSLEIMLPSGLLSLVIQHDRVVEMLTLVDTVDRSPRAVPPEIGLALQPMFGSV